MTEAGDVYVAKIEELILEDNQRHIRTQPEKIQATVLQDTLIHVKDLKNVKQICCGNDHFLCLLKNGQVYAMGDDTFGQCGQGEQESKRNAVAPFFEQRFGKPVHVKFHEKIVKIACGYRHNIVISESGACYGWGYNHQQ